jgi:hypothetical protein
MDGHMFDGLWIAFLVMVPLSIIGIISTIYGIVKFISYISQHLHWVS